MLSAISLSMPASLSEIFTKFPLKDSFKLLDSIGCFFRTVERFQQLCSFARWRNVRAWYSSAVRDIYRITKLMKRCHKFARLSYCRSRSRSRPSSRSRCPPVQNCSPNSHGTCCRNVLRVFDVCSEINL